MYIKLDDNVIILPPKVAKKLQLQLKDTLSEYEEKHGKIKKVSHKRRVKESVPRRVIRELYKSRKVSSKLVSINTKKRKHKSSKND